MTQPVDPFDVDCPAGQSVQDDPSAVGTLLFGQFEQVPANVPEN